MNLSMRKKIFFLIALMILVFFLGLGTQFLKVRDVIREGMSAMEMLTFSESMRSRINDHLKWMNDLYSSFISGRVFNGQLDPKQCDFGKWYYSFQFDGKDNVFDRKMKPLFDAIEAPHLQLHTSTRRIVELMKQGDRKKAYDVLNKNVIPAFESTRDLLSGMMSIIGEKEKNYMNSYYKIREGISRFLLIFSILFIIVIVPLSVFVVQSILKRIGHVTVNLASSSSQMNSASNQLSEASQSIAKGTVQQAESIQETSASLMQIIAIAAQNVDNAKHANQFMENTTKLVDTAQVGMESMAAAMRDIVYSSQEIGKIIKTIDEIAFQTNLLALNAAVEAARAGEAGAGFAVVADEVRNLAQRSAESAKNTQNLVDDVVKKIRLGEDIVEGTQKSFSQVVEATNGVVQAVREITISSDQQSKGIEDIQQAITELENVIQKNASTSEETSSAAEELHSQAESILGIVKELNTAVFGKKDVMIFSGKSPALRGKPGAPERHMLAQSPETEKKKNFRILPNTGKGTNKEVKPDEILPLDEKEMGGFKDFEKA
ncbi:MAG: methyl-accepting chemotaxis protein [bacterium]|nr:methyl-accepting chemotaxis protein [bacterium]